MTSFRQIQSALVSQPPAFHFILLFFFFNSREMEWHID